jgi:hypothetical protein
MNCEKGRRDRGLSGIMDCPRKYALASGVVIFVVLVVIALGSSKPDLFGNVSIELLGYSNSTKGSVILLQMSNAGPASVRFDPFGALYWTNSSGVPTDRFFEHNLGGHILRPGSSTIVAVPPPTDAMTWYSSFSYAIQPGAMRRALNAVRLWLPGKWVPNDSFVGIWGPVITNATRVP